MRSGKFQFLSFLLALSFFFSWSPVRAESFPVRKQIASIIFAGLGGAVIGLSTLSFYGEPQEHINNIWTGLGLGIIAGTGYVTYQTFQNNYVPSEAIYQPRFRNSAVTLVQLQF